MKRVAAVVVLMLSALPSVFAQAQSLVPFFNVRPGTRWVYRAKVKWTAAGDQVKETTVDWPVEVTAVVTRPTFSAVLLKGSPTDLAAYKPDVQPEVNAIVQVGNTVYLVLASDARDTFEAVQNARSAKEVLGELTDDDLWFKLPLTEGARYCTPDQQNRDDRAYCWSVESVAMVPPTELGGASQAAKRGFELMYRTNPDHQTYTLVPGVGITHYAYSHHGTVAEVDAQLVKFTPAP